MNASQKEVVQALIKYLGKELKDMNGIIREFVIYECPEPTCSTSRIFQSVTGYKNPYKHLKRWGCYVVAKNPEFQS